MIPVVRIPGRRVLDAVIPKAKTHAVALSRRCRRSSPTAQPFSLLFSQRVVSPAAYRARRLVITVARSLAGTAPTALDRCASGHGT